MAKTQEEMISELEAAGFEVRHVVKAYAPTHHLARRGKEMDILDAYQLLERRRRMPKIDPFAEQYYKENFE